MSCSRHQPFSFVTWDSDCPDCNTPPLSDTAMAVLAERERCAKIAEQIRIDLESTPRRRKNLSGIDEHVAYVCDGIAARIRKQR